MEPGLDLYVLADDWGRTVSNHERVGGDSFPLGGAETPDGESFDVNNCLDPANLKRQQLNTPTSQMERDDRGFTAATGHSTNGVVAGEDGRCIEESSLEPIGIPASTGLTGLSRIRAPFSQDDQLKWQAHMISEWHGLCDGALQDISQIEFHVETDKGFKFSELDDSFLCQKKNHFQITVTTIFHKIPKFVKLKDGSVEPVEKFMLCLEGVKFEDINSKIKLKQSKKIDRSKIDYKPIRIDPSHKPSDAIKTTICRLHFSETTANNTRKRGKPNPDQKYFSLVVSLKALTKEVDSKPLTIVAHVSERIIVRTSSTNIYDVDNDPIPEPNFEQEDCQKEISVLKSAIKELQDIVSDLQQRLGMAQEPFYRSCCSHNSQLHGAAANYVFY